LTAGERYSADIKTVRFTPAPVQAQATVLKVAAPPLPGVSAPPPRVETVRAPPASSRSATPAATPPAAAAERPRIALPSTPSFLSDSSILAPTGQDEGGVAPMREVPTRRTALPRAPVQPLHQPSSQFPEEPVND
jgi:hypothetical protein